MSFAPNYGPFALDPNKIQDPTTVWGGAPTMQGPPKRQSFNLWDRLQQGVAPYPEHLKGLIDNHDVQGARNQGLIAAGASMLESAGRSTQPTSLGQAIGRGLTTGMGTYQNAVDNLTGRVMSRQKVEESRQGMDMNKMKMEGFKSEQAKMAQLDAARKGILEKHGPLPDDPEQRQGYLTSVMNDLISAGDIDSARAISEVLKSHGNQAREPGEFVTVPGPDGKPQRRYIRESDGPTTEYEKPVRDAGAQLLDQQRMFTRAAQLRDDYTGVTKNIAQAANQYRTMVAAAEGAKQGSPAAQIALVFSYMKTLDPTSVVRESEYATAENARGVPESIRNQYNKVLKGSRLTPTQIDDFMSTGRRSAAAWKRQMDYHRKVADGRANRWGVSADDVTEDYFSGLPLDEQGAAPMNARGDFGGGQ